MSDYAHNLLKLTRCQVCFERKHAAVLDNGKRVCGQCAIAHEKVCTSVAG